MNIEEIGIEQKHPSSIGETLKRCAVAFSTVNAARSLRTLAGLPDPISKNFRIKTAIKKNEVNSVFRISFHSNHLQITIQ